LSNNITIKIENRGSQIFITKGTESVWLNIDYKNGTIHISATDRSGGRIVKTLKFEEDEVVEIDN
jgi:hypothetical protein